MTGEKIHHYIITRLIGEGGMAAVYEAVHEKLQSKVAVKVLNPMLAANSSIRQRFENEARFMAGLSHPNITRVIDYEERPDLLAIIMEFLEGEDLNVLIKKNGPMPLNNALGYFIQVLDAFDYAHNKAIVHRDVKPSNIFIEPSNSVKILDFGIAKLLGAGDDMTMTGTQIGTPVYMSPEQVNTDKTIDHRSDIYSLGVTLYYMLKGEPPYDTTTTSSFQIYTKIVHEPLPDLAEYPEIDKIIKIATHKDREKRFQTCKAFSQALVEATQPKKPVMATEKPVANFDAEKTLIDMPEPLSKEPVQPAEKKGKKKVEENKKETRPKPSVPKKNRIILLLLVALPVIAIAIILTFYPSWISGIFQSDEKKQAKAQHYLYLGKIKLNKDKTKLDKDSAVYYLKLAAKYDPDNPEILDNLGNAIFRAGMEDSLDIPSLSYQAVAGASDQYEGMIRIDAAKPVLSDKYDPYSMLTSIWGKLALKYFVENKNDSALMALREGRKRGGFNDVLLENARNTANSCDRDAILFTVWDISFYPLLYVQAVENLRTDITPLITDFFEQNWYFSFMKNKQSVPFSFGETWFGLMYEKDFSTTLMTIENVNTGEPFSWYLSISILGKFSKRDQVMLDIITANKFLKPIHYSLFFDILSFHNGALSLNHYLHPAGLVYKFKTFEYEGGGVIQESALKNLGYEAIKKTSIPSTGIKVMLDYIRNTYLQLIDDYYSRGNRPGALEIKKLMDENIPEENYPLYFNDVKTHLKSVMNKLEYTDEQRLQKEKENIREYMQENNLTGTPTSSGLYIIPLREGTGQPAAIGKTLKVQYKGTLLDGTKFDSSYDRGTPMEFVLGETPMIKGWDEGLWLMKKGAKSLLIVPYNLGYGEREFDNMPAYSTLVFEIELLDVY